MGDLELGLYHNNYNYFKQREKTNSAAFAISSGLQKKSTTAPLKKQKKTMMIEGLPTAPVVTSVLGVRPSGAL